MADSQERKRQIMEHIRRTTKLPQQQAMSMDKDARKQQIMEHIKRTRG